MVNNIYHSVSLTPGLGYLTSLGAEMQQLKQYATHLYKQWQVPQSLPK